MCTTIQCVVPWAHTSLRPNSNRYGSATMTMTLLIYIILYIYFDRSSTFAGITVASNMPKSYALNLFQQAGFTSKVPFPAGDLDPLLTYCSLSHKSLPHKLPHMQFSHFCMAHSHDIQTNHATPSATTGHINGKW